MRACVVTEFNQPWQMQQLDDPRPGAGQVVIRIQASGMCGTDLHLHHGYLPGVNLPLVGGHEPVGEIVELGAGVTGLEVGDRVGVSWFQKGCGRCHACQEQRILYCSEAQSWVGMGGGNCELMVAWADGCTLVPEGVSSEEAAPMFCAGYTVFSGLRIADPRPGERVAVLGIGGLGHLGVQFAAALGLETVAITGREEKRAEAKELGATEVVIARDNVGEALMAAGGADVILSTTNSPEQISSALTGLRPRGRLVNMGVPGGALQIDANALMFPPRSLLGSTQMERSDLVETLDLLAAGKVKPRLETYSLEEANKVRDRLAEGAVRYKAVLTP